MYDILVRQKSSVRKEDGKSNTRWKREHIHHILWSIHSKGNRMFECVCASEKKGNMKSMHLSEMNGRG